MMGLYIMQAIEPMNMSGVLGFPFAPMHLQSSFIGL